LTDVENSSDTTSLANPRIYTQKFYESQRSDALKSARQIAPFVYNLIQPASVVDIGCGVGAWLKAFSELGAKRIHGYDGAWLDPNALCIPPECFSAHDLSHPLKAEGIYDLAICLEAAEHVPESNAKDLVSGLTHLAPVVLFSAAIPNQEGRGHINEQWPSYWSNLFEEHDYSAIDCIRPLFWNNDDVRWWYKQNAMLFVRKKKLQEIKNRLDGSYFTEGAPMPLVHPELFAQKFEKLVFARAMQEKRGVRLVLQAENALRRLYVFIRRR
jgi:SAM-dependent methyltransferase